MFAAVCANYASEGMIRIKTAALGSLLAVGIAASPLFAQKPGSAPRRAAEGKDENYLSDLGVGSWFLDVR